MRGELAVPSKDEPISLGEYLKSIRQDRKLTLRAVEEATEKEVSNAYLSQIETGKVKRPSPNVLSALADLYSVSFEGLMRRAGHLKPARELETTDRHGRVATFSEHNLSTCLLYTSPSPRDKRQSRMPSSA